MKLLILFSFIILVSSALDCPSSKWFRYENKCYLIDRGNDSKLYKFKENVDFCKSQNAKPVSILSEEENSLLNRTLPSQYYWIGIKQVDFNKKTYEWLDGSVYNYSNWNVRGGRKYCPGAVFYNGQWWDYTNCDDTNYAFCQIVL